ncbi:type II secretion system protein [Helicobacter sp. MIT 14-3879]|uniref:type II secretion system protein n=1 Tax=Helicobacter sp. MIT 14-3879 TaxID=2040649 RepID=UPI000E1F7327|nr:type II secretion system protein [Helicobacter sp. MIT 14-3879]RDU61569.1 hypothetical protein CQA44_08605 [Helicobacter sp. MIT 14-3879]
MLFDNFLMLCFYNNITFSFSARLTSSRSFSLFELLLCIMIISILSIPALKYFNNKILAIEQASQHIQMLQRKLQVISYESYLSKQNLQDFQLEAILHKAHTQSALFSFIRQGNTFTLIINNEYAQFSIEKSPDGYLHLTCNPNQKLCRKIYHRKYSK